MKLDRADLALLRDVLRILHEVGAPCFLVGAGARVLAVDDRWGILGARATLDWDFAVRVESWEEWRTLRERLVYGSHAPFRVTAVEHRLVHAAGRLLDLVPYGGVEGPPGDIVWPDKTRMSVRGFDESEPRCEAFEVEPGLFVQVACVPSLALLKLLAYQDRRIQGITKDIQDFDWLLSNYERAGNDERIYAELSDVLIDETIEFAEAGALLLGKDVAAIHSRQTIEPLRGLLIEGRDPYSKLVHDVIAVRRLGDEARESELRAQICKRMRSFSLGLGSSVPGQAG